MSVSPEILEKLMSLADGQVLYNNLKNSLYYLAQSIATPYDQLVFPVAIGTRCTYDSRFYFAHQTINTEEDFNDAHWDLITVDDFLTTFSDDLGAMIDATSASYSQLTFPIAEGTYCYYNNVFYKANQDIPTQENWTAAHWTSVTISAELKACFDAINAVGDLVAPDYADLTFPVSKGQFCRHEGHLYEANQNISTAESWTSAHWALDRSIGDVLTDIFGEIASLENIVQVSDTEPTDSHNKLWIEEDAEEEITLPTYAEHTALMNALNQKAVIPEGTKAPGKVYGLDNNNDPVWMDQSGGADPAEVAPIIIDSASGTIASFLDGADDLPIERLIVNINPVQSGSGNPSPDNVRPISGWAGCNIHKTGKNLVRFAESLGPSASYYNGFAAWIPDGLFKIPDRTKAYTYSVYFDCKNVESGSSQAKVWYYGEDGTTYVTYAEGNAISAGQEGWSSLTIPVTNGSTIFFAGLGIGLSVGGIVTKGMVEIGTARTDYEPFGNVTPILWQDEAGTVYSGTLDVTTGVLTVNMACIDVGDYEWTRQTGANKDYYYINITSLPRQPLYELNKTPKAISNALIPTYQNASAWDVDMFVFTTPAGVLPTNVFAITKAKDQYTSASEFVEAMSGVLICYEIRFPYEIQLDAVTIETLYGLNNIWVDTGNIAKVEYRANTKLFIEKKQLDIRSSIAPIEDANTASQAYSAGKYFYRNGNFCKAKTSISKGATFTLDTNYQITTVADELFSLNS